MMSNTMPARLRTLRRVLRALGAGLLALTLGGCALGGTARVDADDQVTFDLTIWQKLDPAVLSEGSLPPSYGCDLVREMSSVPDIIASEFETLSPPGDPSLKGCRIKGATTLRALQDYVSLLHIGDRYVFTAPLGAADDGTIDYAKAGLEVPRLSVTFPGRVLDHDASASSSGDTVTWTPPSASWAFVVATDGTPDPLPWLLGGGFVLGGGAAAVASRLISRRRRTT